VPPFVTDSVTRLEGASGRVVVAASHGGIYAAHLARRGGARAVILNDAGVGVGGAGVAALPWLDLRGLPAACVDHRSTPIGRGDRMIDQGVIARVNPRAAALGVAPGMACAEAARWMADAPPAPPATDDAPREFRVMAHDGPVRLWLLDSTGLVTTADAGHVVVTGSHGNHLGVDQTTALKADARAALFNDATEAPAHAAISRLPALDTRGVAAATVGAFTARIGDGRSTYRHGRLTAVNHVAATAGAKVGMTAMAFVALFIPELKESS
jgi:hypothetical protein